MSAGRRIVVALAFFLASRSTFPSSVGADLRRPLFAAASAYRIIAGLYLSIAAGRAYTALSIWTAVVGDAGIPVGQDRGVSRRQRPCVPGRRANDCGFPLERQN